MVGGLRFFVVLLLILGGWFFYQGARGAGLVLMLVSLTMQLTHVISSHQRQGALRFVAWLAERRAELRRGPVEYAGALLSLDTELVRFQGVASFGLMTVGIPSRWLIRGHDRIGLFRWLFGLGTLLFGWWGIPFGPPKTLHALLQNLRGGERQTLGDLLTRMEELEASMPAAPLAG